MKKLKLFSIPMILGVLGSVLVFPSCDNESEVDKPDGITLTAPQNVTATAKTATVLVKWDAVEDATSYEVKRTFDGTETTYTATQTSYTDASPGVGSNSYVVRALADGADPSEWSTAASCTFEEVVVDLVVPTNLTAKKSGDAVLLTWTAVPGAAGYNIYKFVDASETYKLLDDSTEATYTDIDPLDGNNHYRVSATRGEEETEWTAAVTCFYVNTNFTYDDAITAYDAFNSYMYNTNQKMYRSHSNSGNSRSVNWTQSMYFDMIMNAYRLTEDPEHLQRLADMYKDGCYNYCRFDWYNTTNGTWKWDLYDDPMWWVSALARMYHFVKEFPEAASYGLVADDILAVAMEGFDRIWYGSTTTTGTDYPALDRYGSFSGDDPDIVYQNANNTTPNDTDNHKGGMFWDWKFRRIGKMSCVTFPTIIAAMYLHEALPNYVDDFNGTALAYTNPAYEQGNYLDKAKALYKWATEDGHLFRSSDGAVADSKHLGNDSGAFGSTSIYNQATCIGGGALLYLETGEQKYLDAANKAMEYITKYLSNDNKMMNAPGDKSQSNTGSEHGIYFSILAQYAPILIVDCEQEQHLETIEASIRMGWMNRNLETNLCNKDFSTAPTTGNLSAYTASGIPALMLTFPDIKNRK